MDGGAGGAGGPRHGDGGGGPRHGGGGGGGGGAGIWLSSIGPTLSMRVEASKPESYHFWKISHIYKNLVDLTKLKKGMNYTLNISIWYKIDD